MKITKLTHACLDISDNDERLIIDPGAWSELPEDLTSISGVIVTHVHQDHLDESKIHKIAAQNPSLVIYCTQQVADKLSEDYKITVPEIGTEYTAGAFKLRFYGGLHAVMLDDKPQDENFGVLVNNTLYYPGDSFTPCPDTHQVLAAPATAPWLKMSEAANFITQDSAAHVFPTHNAITIPAINQMTSQTLGGVAEANGKTFHDLQPSESLEV